ncbi:MAG: nodulation protein NfeD [Bacteroidetes bacterium]|nr:nodulation protein NfeD [Bacteroidota bacterium]
MKRRWTISIFLAFALGMLALLPFRNGLHAEGDGTPSVRPRIVRIVVDGSINPASAKYIHDAVAAAAEDQAEAVLLLLDTPGGLLASTRAIVSDFLSSPVPIIVFVAPAGAQAASAGAFITLAGHVAAMAPGTNIGAAHPVSMGEGAQNTDDSTNVPMTKATNDAAAFARTIAEKRGRNVAWAEAAVRGSVSITETEAQRDNVIDLVAKDLPDLLRQLDGWTVETINGMVTLRTLDAEVVDVDMTFQQKLLDTLSNPNIAYILLMLGMYGIFFELYNPGSIFPGVVGGICLVLAFYAMDTLPVNYAGLALIVFGVVLFILEVKVVSHGLLSIGGVVALFLGSVMLIESPPGAEFLEISLSVILAVTACTAAFFLFVVGKGLAAMRRIPTTGTAGMVGEIGRTVNALAPTGTVAVHGELWNARSADDGKIDAGTPVRVVGVQSLAITVVPVSLHTPQHSS